MIDNDAIANIREVLSPYLEAKWPGILVLQKNMPTQQGVPTGACVFIEHISDHRAGWSKTNYQLPYDPSDPDQQPNLIPTTTLQLIETRFQFSSLAPQNPEDLTLPTAADVIKYTALLFSADAILSKLRARGLNTQRITEVRNPYFDDDRDRFEAHPSFDVILQHSDTLDLNTDAFMAFDYDLHRV